MFSTRKITYLATLTTASVAIIIVLSSLTPIAIYPDIRISFEGVLIKLTGYLFGPIFGVISASLAEFLLLLFRPGIVHWIYTLAIILYGLFGGLAYLIKNKTKNPVLCSALFNSTMSIGIIFFAILSMSHIISIINTDSIEFFSLFHVPTLLLWIFMLIVGVGIIAYSVWSLIYSKITKKETTISILNNVGPIIFLCILTEIQSVLLVSYGNSIALTQKSSYISWLTLSLAEMPIRIIFNVIIIFSGWKILSPLIKIERSSAEKHLKHQSSHKRKKVIFLKWKKKS
ncbi:hypothetical protein ASO20_01715 [Mycoplasma sp. (ex Biomphalaria glabrata)]|uniref:hypothetical protein n=1 Tax=Mycoplasma sp. (ex Biomphalaria glabrata) TaxID=1749074 RepID=UPI00073AABDA|nr:hypothetical protein [Mycoplasma sp. (ex Biomphalaria glabrata)]ALV23365.1 hypothetical protein ASO20_01715 [Mycoplasma sp. (ex Biomphalaria glabrata)]